MHICSAIKKINYRWLDFASVVIFGDRPQRMSQTVVGQLMTLVWSGLLGITYAYLLPKVGERNRRFKGILFGVTTWFSIYTAVHLVKEEKLLGVSRRTATVHGVTSALWGIVMDESLRRMERWTERVRMAPEAVPDVAAVEENQDSTSSPRSKVDRPALRIPVNRLRDLSQLE